MAFLGMLLLGVLGAVYFLMWATQQHEPAHADIGAIAERGEHPRQREVPSEDGPRVSFARYDQPSQARQAPYEQPQAQYPEMPLDEPYPPEPGKYD